MECECVFWSRFKFGVLEKNTYITYATISLFFDWNIQKESI